MPYGRTPSHARAMLQAMPYHASYKQTTHAYRRTAAMLLSTTATRGQSCGGERETWGCR